MFIKKIEQVDRFTFMIEWTDGLIGKYRLSDLQKHCPCVRCEQRSRKVEKEVMARRIFSVGVYAIGIEFTSGCSKGIYPYSLLRRFL